MGEGIASNKSAGGAGYIGSHTAGELKKAGYDKENYAGLGS